MLCRQMIRMAPVLSLAVATLVPEAAAQGVPPRDRRATERFVAYYEESDAWPVRALALLSLGSHWHPVGTPALCDALGGSDERMRPFGIEVLRRTRADVLRAVATEVVVDELLDLCKSKHPMIRSRALEVVSTIAGDAPFEDRRDAERWWRQSQRAGYAAAPWPEIDGQAEQNGGTTTEPLLDRALDLRDAGLDLVIVIDSTGSMQRVIDSAVQALDDVVAVLGDVAPRLRVGLVHYRDFEDMSDGADLRAPLTRNVSAVRKKLETLRAGGGGDTPERVEKGIEIALDPTTGWDPDANKLILLVGDAPPHVETEKMLLEMVRGARENPTLRRGRSLGPSTGARKALRPFVTAAISANQQADRPFREIAEAGGGIFATLGERRVAGGRPVAAAEPPSVAITRHVLAGSFGSQWRDRIGEFVSIWFEYR